MIQLRDLYHFYVSQKKSTQDFSPEIALKHFFLSRHIKMSLFHDYFYLTTAVVNQEKYKEGFGKKIIELTHAMIER